MEKLKFKECEDCIEWNGNRTHCANVCSKPFAAMDGFNRYMELEEQGLLLKLPCKVGDKVYSVENNGIKEFIVSDFDICMKGIYAYQGHIFIGEMGFSVFATKEEAEAALKEMEEK